MSKRRMYQVNELLRQEISRIVLTDLNDPRLQLVTITAVHASADLQHAKVFFHVHGAEQVQQSTEQGLQSARGRIRHLLGQRVRIKYIPELVFQYDDRLDYAERIYDTLRHLKDQEVEDSQENEQT